jgi:glycosyltransferase involved in cell wall biosynthesis
MIRYDKEAIEKAPTVVVICRDIGNYHAARFAASCRVIPSLTVIETCSQSEYREFKATGASPFKKVTLYQSRQDYQAAFRSGELWRKLQMSLASLSPDVVAVSGWATAESFAAIDWARVNGRGLVVLSESQSSDAERSAFRELLKRRVVQQFDAALVGGQSHAKYIYELGLRANTAFLGYDVVDNDYFSRHADEARLRSSELRQELGLPGRYILASGRFVPKKNLPTMVHAYAEATASVVDSPDLVVIGDGPERAAVEAAIRASNVSKKVHLIGFRSYEVLPALYGLAEAFIHVSTSEQWGLVVNEACASGVPIILSKACGSAPELLADGHNGYLVDPNSIRSIAEAVRRISLMPAAERAIFGNAGRRLIAHWGPDRFASGLLAACSVAKSCRPRRYAYSDRLLVRLIATRSIESVM